jgi:predicted metalloprotease with PDZ domain
VRIAVAAEIIKAWIGERLWIGPSSPGREAEAYWFTEGVTRHLARDLQFRFGLITHAEMLDELNGLCAATALSPMKTESNSALAAKIGQPGVLPLLVARGALYAARVDALLRKEGKKAAANTAGAPPATAGAPSAIGPAGSGNDKNKKRSLEALLRSLYEKAREQRGPLPVSAWTDALTAELGAAEAGTFQETIEKGGEIKLPDDALGPCFRLEKRRYEPFDTGFDESPASDTEPRKVASVAAGGPAAKAGLRAGDVIIEAQITKGRSDVPVTLVIERGKERKTITYRPAGPFAAGQGFVRKKDVPDEACFR